MVEVKLHLLGLSEDIFANIYFHLPRQYLFIENILCIYLFTLCTSIGPYGELSPQNLSKV